MSTPAFNVPYPRRISSDAFDAAIFDLGCLINAESQKPRAGTADLLQDLRAEGIKTAAFSSLPTTRDVNESLDRVGMLVLMDSCTESRAAEGVSTLSEQFANDIDGQNIPPHRIMLVTNSLAGAQAGSNMKLGRIVGTVGDCSKHELLDAGADIIIDRTMRLSTGKQAPSLNDALDQIARSGLAPAVIFSPDALAPLKSDTLAQLCRLVPVAVASSSSTRAELGSLKAIEGLRGLVLEGSDGSGEGSDGPADMGEAVMRTLPALSTRTGVRRQLPIFVGTSNQDEAGFQALQHKGLGVLLEDSQKRTEGPRRTAASFTLENYREAGRFTTSLAHALLGPSTTSQNASHPHKGRPSGLVQKPDAPN